MGITLIALILFAFGKRFSEGKSNLRNLRDID